MKPLLLQLDASPYCSDDCQYLDSQSSSQHIFASRTPVQRVRPSTSRWSPSPVPSSPSPTTLREVYSHSAPLPTTRPSSSKWAGNDRAGIQTWARGVWGTASEEDDVVAEDDSDRLSFSSRQSGSTQDRSSRRTRRRTVSPLLISSAPRLLSAQQLAAPAVSIAPLARASTLNSSDDDLTSLMTPSSTSSAAIPVKSHGITSKVRSWVLPTAHDDSDPWISSPPYESFIPTVHKKTPYAPDRGRALVRPDWL